MSKNRPTNKDADEAATARWVDDGGTTPPFPSEKRWARALARHWHGYRPTPETQARARQETKRSQKPTRIASRPPEQ